MPLSSKIKAIDTHCHVNFKDYDADRDEVIKRALDAGVGMIVVGTNKKTSQKAVEIAEKYDDVFAIVGLHPIYAHKEIQNGGSFDADYYLKLAGHEKVVGIGECGFDYYHIAMDIDDKSVLVGDTPLFIKDQKEAFTGQIDIANQVKKPLMLHIRNSPKGDLVGVDGHGDAYNDAIKILRLRAKVKGNAHFFAGSSENAKYFLDMGYTMSWTGVVTFTSDYDNLIKSTPSGAILSETDAPYVSPVPHRGHRNEPLYVRDTIAKMASIRGEDLAVFESAILANAKALFGI